MKRKLAEFILSLKMRREREEFVKKRVESLKQSGKI